MPMPLCVCVCAQVCSRVHVPWFLQRVNDESKVWAIPVKDGTDSMADPFLDQAMKKKERVVKNKLNQLKNLVRARVVTGGLCDCMLAPHSSIRIAAQ